MEIETNKSKIKLDAGIGLTVWKELEQKHGIKPRKNKLGLIDFYFLEEEIALIKTLRVNNPSPNALKGISNLFNLENLMLVSQHPGDYTQEKDIYSINDKTMKEISEVTSLKQLTLTNQHGINWMDLSKLKNLEALTITHCVNLEEIYDIDKLNKLFSLTCYGNRSLVRY